MSSRNRVGLVFSFAMVAALLQSSTASSQRAGFFGGERDEASRDEGGERRINRDNDGEPQGGLRFGDSDAQNIQDAIQTLQGGSRQQQQFDGPGPNGPQHQSGRQFNKSQHWQNSQHQGGDQAHWKKKHKHHDWDSWSIHFGGPAPFSVDWYKHHPKAWQHHHDDDAWKWATAAGVLTWLGWQGHHPHHHTVIYEPLPPEVIYVDGRPTFDPHSSHWMTLGVYSMLTSPGDSGTRMLELAVDKHGFVRGNYYDMITGMNHRVTGRIHEPTQYVQWSLDRNRELAFFAPLRQLTQPEGRVHVRFPSGQRQEWHVVRMEYASN